MPEHVAKRGVDIRLPRSTAEPEQGRRSVEKIHVSDVLQFVGYETGVLDREEKFSQQSTRFRLALGIAWEDYLARMYPEIRYHPGEFELDGIVGSPDGLGEVEETGELSVEEFKLTWLSAKWQLSEKTNRIRMWQVKAYCKLLGVRDVHLWVGYLNGDYNRGGPMVFAPEPVVYDIRFSQEEVDANWRMMLANVPDMLEDWKKKGWWEGGTSEWRTGRKGAGRITAKKIEESDLFGTGDLDLLEDAISA